MDDETKKAVERFGNQMANLANLKVPALAETLAYTIPKIEIPPNPNLASEFYSRLVAWITEFDESLDDNHEVGVRLVNFGQAISFHLTSMGYWNPSLIKFLGITDKDEPVELIQHVTQISILLMKMPRKNLDQPKRSIGFASLPPEEGPDV